MAAGMSRDADLSRLTDRLGQRWALLETSFKYHASCRHTHPAADALLQLMGQHGLSAREIVRVNAKVHVAALKCWARWRGRRRCTRPSFPWARCWG